MIPDLGKYAIEVLTVYVVSIAILVGVVAITLHRSRKVKARLAAVEAMQGDAK